MAAPILTRRQALMAALACGLAAPALARASAPSLRVGAILPLAGRGLPEAAVNLSIPAEAARKGLVLALDDLERATPQGTTPHQLLLANAPEADSARRAAERLVEHDRATVLIGGFSAGDARAIGQVAQAAGALFINIAAPAEDLRAEFCTGPALHVEAGAGTYLSALAGLYQSQGRRRWHLIHQDDPAGQALLAQAQADLPHMGAEIAGISRVTGDSTLFRPALAELANSGADAALMLTDWLVQLNLLATAESEGAAVPLTGFPWTATQTREFYNRARQLAPTLAPSPRVALWEARLDSPEAAALSADFLARWRVPMDAPAWASQAALRMAADATQATGSTRGSDLAAWLSAPARRPALGKHAAFDPADGQLRQPLYAVRINPAASSDLTPQAMTERAELIGQIDPQPAAAADCRTAARAG